MSDWYEEYKRDIKRNGRFALWFDRGLFMVILVMFLTGCAMFLNTAPKDPSFDVQVLRVIDGDTIEVASGCDCPDKLRIRLLGVDAPERGQEGFQEAKYALEAILSLPGRGFREVRLVSDRPCQIDPFGRRLAYVELPEDLDVGKELIRAGHARVYRKFPFKRMDEYWEVENAL